MDIGGAVIQGAFLKGLTARVFTPGRKSTLVSFRTIISLVLLFFALYCQENPLTSQAAAGLLAPEMKAVALHFLSNLFVLILPSRSLGKGLVIGLFLFDISTISAVVYLTQGFQNDLFFTYFLVVFMTVIARKPSVSFLVAGISCLLYGFFFFKSHAWTDFFQSFIIIRFSLLLVVAFFSSTIVEDLEAQEDVVHHLSHELRNSLASIHVASRLLLQETSAGNPRPDQAGQAKMASIIARSSARMIQMVDDILELFRYETGKVSLKRTPVSVGGIVRECAEEFSLSGGERGLPLSEETEPVLPQVMADPVKLRQALLNLLGNALKFTPAGGVIAVGARLWDSDPKARTVEIYVADTGTGMAPEQLKRIFEKFYQANGPAAHGKLGIGLGLALVKSIIEAHEGSISVKSAPGKGTSFSIRLPAAAGAADAFLTNLRKDKSHV